MCQKPFPFQCFAGPNPTCVFRPPLHAIGSRCNSPNFCRTVTFAAIGGVMVAGEYVGLMTVLWRFRELSGCEFAEKTNRLLGCMLKQFVRKHL
jgi:hypothetical protein